MNNSQTYEKVVKVKLHGKQLSKTISLLLSYFIFFSIWMLFLIDRIHLFVPIVLAAALSTLLLVLLTWKYVCLEYEYSFWYGKMTVSKIYGKRKRRTVVEAEMPEMLYIAPATDVNIKKCEHFSPAHRIIAVSTESAENIWLAVSGDKDKKTSLIFFEADERSLGILKSSNPISFSKN